MIPLVIYTSKRSMMGEFTNGPALKYLSYLSAIAILCLNAYLIYTFI